MTVRNYIMTDEDEALISSRNLKMWADYEGDHQNLLALRAMARKLLLISNPALAAASVAAFLDDGIDTLQVSVRTGNVLENTGYTTVRKVFEGGWAYLLRQRNFGERSRLELVDLFSRHGLIWQEQPCDAPNPVIPEQETQIDCPTSLYQDLLDAARANLANYEKAHGRFATRGKLLAEHERLTRLVQRAEARIGVATA
ncbi:hypothetical protein F7430_22710 [Salmonella enterica]|nr:hypothetical protein [Salmonella enterica]